GRLAVNGTLVLGRGSESSPASPLRQWGLAVCPQQTVAQVSRVGWAGAVPARAGARGVPSTGRGVAGFAGTDRRLANHRDEPQPSTATGTGKDVEQRVVLACQVPASTAFQPFDADLP